MTVVITFVVVEAQIAVDVPEIIVYVGVFTFDDVVVVVTVSGLIVDVPVTIVDTG